MCGENHRTCFTGWQWFLKRGFDIVFSAIGLVLTFWIILLAYVVATFDTGKSGFFRQKRVGLHGKLFEVIKIRTMREMSSVHTNVTIDTDPRITPLGRFFRKTKIDELPQLINILLGQMSFVGPRPDVPGFADEVRGADRVILSVRPGITGPATLKYRNEEKFLAKQADPEQFNRDVIFPDKVRINKEYIENYSFFKDLVYIYKTLT
jgi:lipopolysaccharide/colanic/teichoic acid biosynthesis glycosyltransferase